MRRYQLKKGLDCGGGVLWLRYSGPGFDSGELHNFFTSAFFILLQKHVLGLRAFVIVHLSLLVLGTYQVSTYPSFLLLSLEPRKQVVRCKQ